MLQRHVAKVTGLPFKLVTEEWVNREPPRGTNDELWTSSTGRRDRGKEQDRAAGGPEKRLIKIGKGQRVRATAWFKRTNGYV